MLQEKKSCGLNPTALSPGTLAFIGDAVFEVMVRDKVIADGGSRPASELHRLAVEFVSAHAQSQAAEELLPLLTEEENAVFRRGRNANSVHPPKNADPAEYRRATGLEALIGWLHLRGEDGRVSELFGIICEIHEKNAGNGR